MSAFLGKIHYWLYDKIKLHENFIKNITDLAERNGINCDELVEESYKKYGFPTTGLLEDEIEHENIHGWLQIKITSVESRLAFVVTELLKNEAVKIQDIADVFNQNGQNAMNSLGIKEGLPQEFFQLIFDHMLEGMPCDRVNEILENSESLLVWETTRDLHKGFWDEARGEVANYHLLRDAWICGFLAASGTGYSYERTENGINRLGRI